MRFIFCAACISYVLNDWTGMDIELTVDYIRRSFVSLFEIVMHITRFPDCTLAKTVFLIACNICEFIDPSYVRLSGKDF